MGTVARLIYPRCMCQGFRVECAGRLELHHMISCGVKHFRHDLRNASILCSNHHRESVLLSPHGNPKAFEGFMRNEYNEQFKWVEASKWQGGTKDYKAAFERLEGFEKLLRNGMRPEVILGAIFKKQEVEDEDRMGDTE